MNPFRRVYQLHKANRVRRQAILGFLETLGTDRVRINIVDYYKLCHDHYLVANRRGEKVTEDYYQAQLYLLEWMLQGTPNHAVPLKKEGS